MTKTRPPYLEVRFENKIELQLAQIEALKAELVNLRAALWQAEGELRRVCAENEIMRADLRRGGLHGQ